MPITIDLRDHALYKLGAEEGAVETERIAIIEMLKDGVPIDKIVKYLKVSIDEIIAIKNELDEQK